MTGKRVAIISHYQGTFGRCAGSAYFLTGLDAGMPDELISVMESLAKFLRPTSSSRDGPVWKVAWYTVAAYLEHQTAQPDSCKKHAVISHAYVEVNEVRVFTSGP